MQIPVRLFIQFTLVMTIMVGLSAMLIAADLHGPITGLDALHALSATVTLVAALSLIVNTVRILRLARKAEQNPSEETILDIVDRIAILAGALILAVNVMLWSIIAGDLISAIRHFMAGETGRGIVDLLLVLFLLWVVTRNKGKGQSNPIKKLIGEKSRALRDALIEAGKGMQPNPGMA